MERVDPVIVDTTYYSQIIVALNNAIDARVYYSHACQKSVRLNVEPRRIAFTAGDEWSTCKLKLLLSSAYLKFSRIPDPNYAYLYKLFETLFSILRELCFSSPVDRVISDFGVRCARRMQALHAARLEGNQAGARVRTLSGGSPEAHMVGVLQAAGLREEQMGGVSAPDVDAMRYVAHVVSLRAAQLIACALAIFVERVGRARVSVAVDGSVFKLHPRLSTLIAQFVAQFVPHCQVLVLVASDT